MKCHIVQDLLPLYAEHLTAPETDEAVHAHLEGCPQCQAVFAVMQEQSAEQIAAPPDVRPLKKIKRSSLKTALLIYAFVTVLWVLFYIFCIHGIQLRSDQIQLEVSTYYSIHSDEDPSLHFLDSREEAEAAMARANGRDFKEYVSVDFHGDWPEWVIDCFNTYYERDQEEESKDARPSMAVYSFRGTLLPHSLHRSFWAAAHHGSVLSDGSTVTIRCRDGDFTYDLTALAARAEESPDGVFCLTVGEKIT